MAFAPVIISRHGPPIVSSLTAGGLYFLIAFAVGFVLGAARELVIAPRVTSDLAIVLETPVMAVAVWLGAGFAVRRLDVPGGIATRLPMGVLALVLLLGAEELLTRALRGGSLLEHWAMYGYLATAANLAGLLWFAFSPLAIKAPRPGAGLSVS